MASRRCSKASWAVCRCLVWGWVKGLGPVVNLVDGVSPPGQWCIIGVAGSQVVDIPQQVSPAALYGAVVMVVGSVEVADQRAGGIAQHLVHHRLASVPPQEVSVGGCTAGPHVAVVSILAPAGLIGMDHWAGADLVQDLIHCALGPLRRTLDRSHDGSHAEAQPMDGAQIPLDGANGQSGLLSERGDQADQVDPQTLLAHSPRRPVALGADSGVGKLDNSWRYRRAR